MMLEHQDNQQDKNGNTQADDTTHRPGILLALFRLFQLLNTRLGVFHDSFHIVINAIQNCSLINHQDGKLFENSTQFLDTLSNLGNLLIPTLNRFRQIVHNGHLLRCKKGSLSTLRHCVVEINTKFRVGYQAATLLSLDFGQILSLRLSKGHGQFLQALGETAS
jgi:hypothetical protein